MTKKQRGDYPRPPPQPREPGTNGQGRSPGQLPLGGYTDQREYNHSTSKQEECLQVKSIKTEKPMVRLPFRVDLNNSLPSLPVEQDCHHSPLLTSKPFLLFDAPAFPLPLLLRTVGNQVRQMSCRLAFVNQSLQRAILSIVRVSVSSSHHSSNLWQHILRAVFQRLWSGRVEDAEKAASVEIRSRCRGDENAPNAAWQRGGSRNCPIPQCATRANAEQHH